MDEVLERVAANLSRAMYNSRNALDEVPKRLLII
jgi:hypothetical protein